MKKKLAKMYLTTLQTTSCDFLKIIVKESVTLMVATYHNY